MQRTPLLPLLAALLLIGGLLGTPAAHAAQPVDFRELVKSSVPAVVNVNAERTEQARSFGGPFGNPFDMFRGHPDLEQFFGPFDDFSNRAPRTRKTQSLGSGFIISADGYIVTNNHVVEGADAIRVSISSGNGKDNELAAEVIGTDPETDLALLKVDTANLPFLAFGSSEQLEVGEWVVAIGSPLGLKHTVTAGIVSAKGRNIQSGSYDDYLQTDASINRGNSGGPLINMNGEVIGINTAIAQRAQGIGFAIPSDLAQDIIAKLKEHKKVSRGWLGVTIQNVDDAMAKALGMNESKGALVNGVLEGQPAALAGIKEGDVIIAINGKEIGNTEQLLRIVASLNPGESAKVTVWRDGKETVVSLTVAERDMSNPQGKSDGKTDSSDTLLGLKLRPVTPEDARRYRIKEDKGLLVTAVEPESPAAEAGIQPGDVVLAVDKTPVTSLAEMDSKIKDAEKKKGVVLLHLSRRGQVFFQAIDLAKK